MGTAPPLSCLVSAAPSSRSLSAAISLEKNATQMPAISWRLTIERIGLLDLSRALQPLGDLSLGGPTVPLQLAVRLSPRGGLSLGTFRCAACDRRLLRGSCAALGFGGGALRSLPAAGTTTSTTTSSRRSAGLWRSGGLTAAAGRSLRIAAAGACRSGRPCCRRLRFLLRRRLFLLGLPFGQVLERAVDVVVVSRQCGLDLFHCRAMLWTAEQLSAAQRLSDFGEMPEREGERVLTAIA